MRQFVRFNLVNTRRNATFGEQSGSVRISGGFVVSEGKAFSSRRHLHSTAQLFQQQTQMGGVVKRREAVGGSMHLGGKGRGSVFKKVMKVIRSGEKRTDF